MKNTDKLDKAKKLFIEQWGTLSSAWGVNRTFAQIQALLLVSEEPLSTDHIMEKLSISRGNAHSNLKEMVNWGLAQVKLKPGDRKDYFIGEKDPWKMFCAIVGERRRREVVPTVNVLEECINETEDLQSEEARQFNDRMKELTEFVATANNLLNKVLENGDRKVFKLFLKMMK